MTAPKPSSPKKPLNNSAKYISMATFMAVVITGGTFGGRWLDTHLQLVKFPVFTLSLSLLSVFGAMWYFIRDFTKK